MAKSKPDASQPWRNRIVGHGSEAPDQLLANPRNWRLHPRAQQDALSGVLSEVGWVQQVLVNRRTGHVVDGHLRVNLAISRGEPSIPVTYLDLSEAEEAVVLATFDPIGALAGTDQSVLDDLLRDAAVEDPHLVSFLAGLGSPKPVVEDEVPPVPAEPITRPGDLWLLGEHRLLCGDAMNAGDMARLIGDVRVNLAVTSPPYAEQRAYDPTSPFQPVPPDQYVEWIAPVVANIAHYLASDGSWLLNIKPAADGLETELYVFDLVLAHVRQWGWHLATEFCWERAGVPKSPTLRLKNQFEPVYQFTRGRWKFRPEHVRHPSDAMIVPIGEGAGDTRWDKHQGNGAFFRPQQVRKRKNGTTGSMSSVQGMNAAPGQALQDGWAYPGNRLPTFAGTHDALGHPAAFPVGLPGFFIRLFTDTDDHVVDPFVGSGSTLIAAEQLGRRCYALEISPAYCDVAVRRWERVTGRTAVREPSQVVA